jgi:hypothetical protein
MQEHVLYTQEHVLVGTRTRTRTNTCTWKCNHVRTLTRSWTLQILDWKIS